tara:strand:+ start:1691 stop:2311 length:621 start_codon:yes stop_codon:yes gene_type:complete
MLLNFLFRTQAYLRYRKRALNAHGLHSPFLFDFYNEVISSKKEFYFFQEFRALLSNYKKTLAQNDALFLFRWAAFYKPTNVRVEGCNFPAALALAIPSNLKNLSVPDLNDYTDIEKDVLANNGVLVQENSSADLLFCTDLNQKLVSSFVNYKCVIIKKPHQNRAKENRWNKLCSSKEISISIDLFQFGILLFDKNQAKQYFVVRMS